MIASRDDAGCLPVALIIVALIGALTVSSAVSKLVDGAVDLRIAEACSYAARPRECAEDVREAVDG